MRRVCRAYVEYFLENFKGNRKFRLLTSTTGTAWPQSWLVQAALNVSRLFIRIGAL